MAVQPSEKWLKQYNSTLVPEMFVQITYHASDDKGSIQTQSQVPVLRLYSVM